MVSVLWNHFIVIIIAVLAGTTTAFTLPNARRRPRGLPLLAADAATAAAAAAAVVVDPSYTLSVVAGAVSAAGGAFAVAAGRTGGGRVVPTLVAGLALFLSDYLRTKTDSVRFAFDDTALSIVKVDGSSVGENPVMGGSYRWRYGDVAEYTVFAVNRVPLLLYLKETATPAADRVEPPVSVSATPGQTHIFPVIGDGTQLQEQLRARLPGKPLAQLQWRVETNPARFLKGLLLI